MIQPKLTFGCFQNWIDLTGLVPVNGVYEFSTYPTPLTNTHAGIYWITKLGALNGDTVDLGAGNTTTVKDLFGAGLFYYDSTTKTYANAFSSEMQHPPLLLGSLPSMEAGCKTTTGFMKSACNLVCFDLVRNLLSDPAGLVERDVIVHHISVATIVNEAESTAVFKHRRHLLESVSISSSRTLIGDQSSSESASILTVAAEVKNVSDPIIEKSSTSSNDKIEGEKLAGVIVLSILCLFAVVGMAFFLHAEQQNQKKEKNENKPALMFDTYAHPYTKGL